MNSQLKRTKYQKGSQGTDASQRVRWNYTNNVWKPKAQGSGVLQVTTLNKTPKELFEDALEKDKIDAAE